MIIETMRYVPESELEGKNVVDARELTARAGSGPYSYECAVCRQPVVEGSPVQLVAVVLQCPHCGAYNEALRNVGVPT